MIAIKQNRYDGIHNTAGSKQAICDAFLKVIQMTAAGEDITALRYDAKTEIVHVDTECNRDIRQINVALDSGWAMIQDIVNNIHIG